jgi:hypothetical protein
VIQVARAVQQPRLARVVGKSMALELVCTGRQVKADEALKIGIANHVVAAEALLEQGLKLARMVAQKGPVAVKMSKHLVQRGQDIDLANANATRPTCSAPLRHRRRRESMARSGKRPRSSRGSETASHAIAAEADPEDPHGTSWCRINKRSGKLRLPQGRGSGRRSTLEP